MFGFTCLFSFCLLLFLSHLSFFLFVPFICSPVHLFSFPPKTSFSPTTRQSLQYVSMEETLGVYLLGWWHVEYFTWMNIILLILSAHWAFLCAKCFLLTKHDNSCSTIILVVTCWPVCFPLACKGQRYLHTCRIMTHFSQRGDFTPTTEHYVCMQGECEQLWVWLWLWL